MLTKYKFYGLDDDTMPIGGYVSPVPYHPLQPGRKSNITDKVYRDVANSGINFLHACHEEVSSYQKDALMSLELAEKHGVKILVRDDNMYAGRENLIEFERTMQIYKDKKSFAGILVSDEPGSALFGRLKEMKEVFEKHFSDRVFYVNLFPLFATSNQLVNAQGKTNLPNEGYTYEQYLMDYAETVKMPFISYDHYPMLFEFPTISDSYYTQISLIRELAMTQQVPFWNFVQCTSWDDHVRYCTFPEMIYQVSCSLAFGCKGIQYFTYATPVNGEVPEGESFNSALIDMDGLPTERYYFAQKINQHIKAVDHILMHCISKGIIQVGSSPVPLPDSVRVENYGELESTVGDGFIIGCLDYNGKSVFYIVNNSITRENEISLKFKTRITFEVIEGESSEIIENDVFSSAIGPGEAILLNTSV